MTGILGQLQPREIWGGGGRAHADEIVGVAGSGMRSADPQFCKAQDFIFVLAAPLRGGCLIRLRIC